MKKIIFIIFIIHAAALLNAQVPDSWTEKNGIGLNVTAGTFMTPRFGAVSFSIGTKGYIGTGNDGTSGYRNDFWEYDPSANTWTQKANIGTAGRELAAGFSIGSKGYIGTGLAPTSSSDFWEYDPSTNIWTQKTSFPGGVRSTAVGFSIAGKGYLGTGTGASQIRKDFWEYNPATNGWTQKADLAGVARYQACGFSTATKGYIGTGSDGTNQLNDFWEYDPSSNTWTQKANFGGVARITAVGFAIGTKGYVGTGSGTGGNLNDFWEYNTSTNAWTQMANFGGASRIYAAAFSIGTKGYLGTGSTNYGTNDLWEFNQSSGTWTLETNPGSTGRRDLAGFSIGNKAYLGTGYDGAYRNDFWEYDVATGIWTQKANFGGVARRGASGFSINGKGYMGTGTNGSYQNDFWEYDPGSNTWTQKANFGGVARYNAVGFSIGSKGYMGTGNTNGWVNDFWEYNPATNVWSQKAAFGGTPRGAATAFSIGSKGYVGMGRTNAPAETNDFWMYNPATDTWTQRTSLPGQARSYASGFSINGKGYIGSGFLVSTLLADFWEYDTTANQWTQRANVGGGARVGAIGFGIGNKGYVGTGQGITIFKNDFWEYTPPCSSATATITTGGPLTFCTGGSVTLTANSGTGLTYQWKNNGNNISGATSVSYTANTSGSYTVTVSNSCNSATSSAVVVTVQTLPSPVITPPGSATFCTGGSVTLQATTGTGYAYQWKKNNVNISGATSSSYAANSAGSYTVMVTNICGSSTSPSVSVTEISSITATITAGGPLTFCTGGFVFLSSNTGAGFTYQWRKNGLNISGATSEIYAATASGSYNVQITSGPCTAVSNLISVVVQTALTPTITSNSTVFCPATTVMLQTPYSSSYSYQWFEDNFTIPAATSYQFNTGHNGNYKVSVTNTCGTYTSSFFNLNNATLAVSPFTIISSSNLPTVCPGGSVTLYNAYYTYYYPYGHQWYKDGIAIPSANGSYYDATQPGNYSVAVTAYDFYCGSSPTVFSNWITVTSSSGTYPAVSISAAGPATFCSGGSVLLQAAATGSAPLTYQWKKNEIDISGATAANYSATTTGVYRCLVTNSCAYVNSSSIAVTATTLIATITSSTTNICSGGVVNINCNNQPGTSYQWKLNGTNISGATFSNYYASAAGTYTCTITNPCGSITSNAITMTVRPKPTAVISGTQSICAGSQATLTISFTGTGNWHGNYFNGSSYTSFNTGTNPYVFNVLPSSTKTYTLYSYFYDAYCNGTVSGSAVVTVISGIPVATISPQGNTTFCSGGSVQLNASTGTNYSYQWKKDAVNISGATASSYTATSTGNYAVQITNACGNATSAIVAVTANALPSATITPAGPTTFCSGGSVVLIAPSGSNRTYQWKKGGTNISGATLSSYTATVGGTYKVTVTNTVTGCSKTTTSGTVVTVNALPAATITPQGPTTFCAGGSVVLAANTGAGLTYKWKKGSSFISGATLSNYTATTGGNYRVQVTNSNGCSKTSALVAVSVPCKEGESVKVGEGESEFVVNVFPNPNSGEFTIKFSNKPSSLTQIEMTDELGKVVKRFETNEEAVVIKESNLAKGIYCLAVRNKDEVVIKKINIVK
ncbi:MAG TPA: kelch repeat-containing protein [Bacteroidia bacterium]|nr:kelch repeat-containing protein [Bacteroidia bacterium]